MSPPTALGPAKSATFTFPAGDVVILRNIDFNGLGAGLNGVRILGAGDVRIENCRIYGWTQRGIVDERTSDDLAVLDTVISNNAHTGILALPGGASSLAINLDRVQMHSTALSTAGGSILSYVMNRIAGNGPPTGTIMLQ